MPSVAPGNKTMPENVTSVPQSSPLHMNSQGSGEMTEERTPGPRLTLVTVPTGHAIGHPARVPRVPPLCQAGTWSWAYRCLPLENAS